MNIVGYQGVVDKVIAFFTKNLAQPWQTMFKVFNRCLTTRSSGHDQTKIKILQLFHAVINRRNVDYDDLLWWDFMSNVFQKKEAIQYPRFTKLIIFDLMKKFPNIPKSIEEDYLSIKDDVPLVSVYTTRNVSVQRMLIPNAFLTAEIRETNDFKDYEMVFMKKVTQNNDQAKEIVKKDDDEFENRLESGSHKENPEFFVDDDDDKATEKQSDDLEFNAHAPMIIEELFKTYVQSNVIHVHPTTTTSTKTESFATLQYQLYLKMKRSLQDRADDIALWETLRRKFEESSPSNTSCREDVFHSQHDENQDDDASPEREKRETDPFETDESATTPRPPPVDHTTPLGARISIQPRAPLPFLLEVEAERLLALPTPPPSLLISLSPPSAEERLARCLAAPAHPPPSLPPLQLSLYLPPPVPTSSPLPSLPLPTSLFIPPPVDRKGDILEVELPPHKRLCLTAPTSRYEVGESSTAAARPTRGHRADYGFIGTQDAETRRRSAEEVGYGIRDVWVDPTEDDEEVAPTTLEGVNAKVTELAEEALVSREDWAQSVGLSLTVHQDLQAFRTHTHIQDHRIALQEALTVTLVAQVSFLQGQLLAALG
uniref:Uncharacterized protein n=1 Tax=Tanacetum cinerariifolium TaxID=118510 RepID=A0A6L2M4U9_TANCI|nr:hypothetical protein [Tanacetum cinerariifolium]